MVKKLSDLKVSKIFDLYFRGYSQTDIANKLKITQAAVSMYVSNFKSLAEQGGIEAAAEEYGVMDQIQVLHDLAADIKKAKITVEEAKTGLEMSLLFQAYGFEQEEYGDLIQTCEKMKNEDYLFAAVKLNQLENSTEMSYEDIIAEGKTTSEKLTQNQKELKKKTEELNSVKQALTDANKQMKLADQNLKTHMQKIGVDANRLKLIETVALALKKAKIPDQELQNFIQQQQSINIAGINIGLFTTILEKANVATHTDGGKSLLADLSECGGLKETINSLKNREKLLEQRLSNLEEQAKLKGELDFDVTKLKTAKSSLEPYVAKLQQQKDELGHVNKELKTKNGELEQVKNEVSTLGAKRNILFQDTNKMEQHNSSLVKEVKSKEQRLIDLKQQESQRQNELKQIEDKVNHKQRSWKVFESFLGLVQAQLPGGPEKFVEDLLILIKRQKENISPDFLTGYVLQQLAGPSLKLWKCSRCQARFAIDKPAELFTGYCCPACMNILGNKVDQEAADILKDAMVIPVYSTNLPTEKPAQKPKNIDGGENIIRLSKKY